MDLGLTQAQVHSAGGPAPATLYLLENGRRTSFSPQVLRRLELALGWRAGSVHRVLAGGPPALSTDEAGRAWAASFRQLPMPPHEKLKILARLLEETITGL